MCLRRGWRGHRGSNYARCPSEPISAKRFEQFGKAYTQNHAALFYEPLLRSAKIGYDNPRPLFLDECPKCHQLIDPNNEPHELLPDDPPVHAHTECPGVRLPRST